MKAAFKHFIQFLLEDKSAVRKSTLNMSEAEAKKAKAKEEEEAKKKARRFGTVSSLMDRFKLSEPKPETYTYKRSPMLDKKEERPKRTYGPIIKPVVNDDFEKQMEEIRQKIHSGNTQLSTQFEDLKKGIATVADDARRCALEEKHKSILNEMADVFDKAEDDTRKWKEQRAADYERELQRQEQELHRAKPAKVIPQKAPEPVPLAERKTTVRRLKPHTDETKPALQDFCVDATKKPTQKVETVKQLPSKQPSSPSTSNAQTKPLSTVHSNATAPTKMQAVPKVQQQGSTPQKPSAIAAGAAVVPKVTDENKSNEVVKDTMPTRKQSGVTAFAKRFDKTVEASAPREQQQLQQPTKGVPFGATKQTASTSTPIKPLANANATTSNQNATPKTDASERRKSEIKSDNSPTTNRMKRVLGETDDRNVQKRYGIARKKTEELMNFAKEKAPPPQDVDKPHRQQCVHRRNRFIRQPFDIDDLLGFNKENTFEQFEAQFIAAARDKRPSTTKTSTPSKKRRLESRKIWISELQDIDKLYKTSELRDIIDSAK